MLKFFKRKSDTPSQPAASARPRPLPPAPGRPASPAPEPPPLPEVTEGNLESDWALWEDSVAFQDSQAPSDFSPLDSVRDRSQPAKEEKIDPYATVRKRG